MKKREDGLIALFGQRLRQLRKAKGFTQERLALESGCDTSYIGLVERGKKSVSLRIIEKVSHTLGVQPLEMFAFRDVAEGEEGDRRIRETFASLIHDPSTYDMLTFALDNVAHYRKTKREKPK